MQNQPPRPLQLHQLQNSDQNRDGYVSSQELMALLQGAGMPPQQAQQHTQDLCRMLGDPVRMDQFIAEYERMSLFQSIQYVQSNMQTIDTNRDGVISMQELQNALMMFMDQMSAQTSVQKIFKAADTNRDGGLTFAELQQGYQNIHSNVRANQAPMMQQHPGMGQPAYGATGQPAFPQGNQQNYNNNLSNMNTNQNYTNQNYNNNVNQNSGNTTVINNVTNVQQVQPMGMQGHVQMQGGFQGYPPLQANQWQDYSGYASAGDEWQMQLYRDDYGNYIDDNGNIVDEYGNILQMGAYQGGITGSYTSGSANYFMMGGIPIRRYNTVYVRGRGANRRGRRMYRGNRPPIRIMMRGGGRRMGANAVWGNRYPRRGGGINVRIGGHGDGGGRFDGRDGGGRRDGRDGGGRRDGIDGGGRRDGRDGGGRRDGIDGGGRRDGRDGGGRGDGNWGGHGHGFGHGFGGGHRGFGGHGHGHGGRR